VHFLLYIKYIIQTIARNICDTAFSNKLYIQNGEDQLTMVSEDEKWEPKKVEVGEGVLPIQIYIYIYIYIVQNVL